MKKALIFCVIMLFFACDNNHYERKQLSAYYLVKNTSNQTISFDVSVKKGEPIAGLGWELQAENGTFTCTVNANDSIIFGVFSIWDDLDNHPNWFTKFDIHSVDDIQMNDPYLSENWIKYHYEVPFFGGHEGYREAFPDSPPAYLLILNKEKEDEEIYDVPFKLCTCEEQENFVPSWIDMQYTEMEVYFFKDSIPYERAYEIANMPYPAFYIIYTSEWDETMMGYYRNNLRLPGIGKICNFPDFAKNMIVPQNGCKVYIEGSMYEPCWGAVGTYGLMFDYVLTKFKIVD